MALIKFNRTAKRAEATDADTIYFPTDEQSIYLGGKRVGGDRVSHADSAESATTAGSATSAETAGTAGKVGHALSLQLNGESTKNFDGSASVTFNVTPSGIGAAPTSHTHQLTQINGAGEAAKKGVSTSIDTSANLPTSAAVKAYVDSQIKNYTSAFRYAGTLGFVSGAWRVNNIPSDISTSDNMDYGTFAGSSEDDSLLKVGFTFYVTTGGIFVNNEVVETGDMVTCVGLYNGEFRWEPSYQIVNSNITVTEQVDNSTKVPTAGAVKTAITDAVNALDSNVVADNNYVLNGVTETDGKLTAISQIAVDQAYSRNSANPASGKAITDAINRLNSDVVADKNYVLTGVTETDGILTAISQIAVDQAYSSTSANPASGKAIAAAFKTNKYTHPTHTATTGVPTDNAAPGFGGSFQVNQITSDSQGHVISSTPRTITIPNTKASDSTDGLMTSIQFQNLNAVLDALTWK